MLCPNEILCPAAGFKALRSLPARMRGETEDVGPVSPLGGHKIVV